MLFPTQSSPFTASNKSIQSIMLQVLFALIPAILTLFYFFGYSILMQISLAILTALITESLCLYLRKKPILSTLTDFSAVLTAVLIAMAIPSIAPWWVVVNGTLFAILIAKQIYGGLGYNPFNPAMAGYVFLLISFPLPMTLWQTPSIFLSFSESINVLFTEMIAIDGLSSATILDYTKMQLRSGESINTIQTQPLFGFIADKNKELVSLAYLIGGLFLCLQKTIRWHIPFAVLIGVFIPASITYAIDPTIYSSPWLHLAAGATLCAAFFIATDPVSAATSVKGRFFYGFLIGFLIFCIRTWGGYPDAVAFAVLLANITAPSIDFYLRPKVKK